MGFRRWIGCKFEFCRKNPIIHAHRLHVTHMGSPLSLFNTTWGFFGLSSYTGFLHIFHRQVNTIPGWKYREFSSSCSGIWDLMIQLWLVLSLAFLGVAVADSSYSLLSPKGVNFEGELLYFSLHYYCIFLPSNIITQSRYVNVVSSCCSDVCEKRNEGWEPCSWRMGYQFCWPLYLEHGWLLCRGLCCFFVSFSNWLLTRMEFMLFCFASSYILLAYFVVCLEKWLVWNYPAHFHLALEI